MPIDWDEFIDQTNQLTASLDSPVIQGASYTPEDPREGYPAKLTLRITGEVETVGEAFARHIEERGGI